MAKGKTKQNKKLRRTFDREFKLQAVQMMLDGYSARSVSGNLGVGNPNLLYCWRAELMTESLDEEVKYFGGPNRNATSYL